MTIGAKRRTKQPPLESVSDYLNRSVWVRIGSVSHGVGVVAIRDIPKGTKITDYDQPAKNGMMNYKLYNFTEKVLGELHPAVRSLIHDRCIFEKGGDCFTYSPNHLQLYREYINHSDFPNVSSKLVSLRHIWAGEEITFSYRRLLRNCRESSAEHHKYARRRVELRHRS